MTEITYRGVKIPERFIDPTDPEIAAWTEGVDAALKLQNEALGIVAAHIPETTGFEGLSKAVPESTQDLYEAFDYWHDGDEDLELRLWWRFDKTAQPRDRGEVLALTDRVWLPSLSQLYEVDGRKTSIPVSDVPDDVLFAPRGEA